jgi:hypothetical protein
MSCISFGFFEVHIWEILWFVIPSLGNNLPVGKKNEE